MSGEALTNNFMLGAATVMIGAQADLFDLVKDTHSIGLVKNFTLSGDPQYLELTQGVKNTIVDSALTNNPIRANMEVYEATPQNLRYALGLEKGSLVTGTTVYDLKADVTAADTSFTIDTDVSSDFSAGDWVVVDDGNDNMWVAKVASAAFSSPDTTITVASGYDAPVGYTAADGVKIRRVDATMAGSKEDQPYLSAKVVGKLSNGTPITLLFPKIRIVRGFNLAFVTDNYGNMPLEFTPYEQTADDPNWGKMSSNSGVVDIMM